MITVNGGCACWKRGRDREVGAGVSVQSMGGIGKDFCPNFLRTFLDNVDVGNCSDESRELISVFRYPHRKCRPSTSAMARTLEYLEGLPS